MRSIWNGSLRFGLITIPVGIAPARVDGDIAFRTLHEPCSTPVSRKAWCTTHDAEVPSEELVRAFEVAPGQFVSVSDAELAEVAPAGDDRTIAISAFLDGESIEPAQIERTYFLTTPASATAKRSYVLLCHVLRELGKVALCRLDFRGNEWLCSVRPHPLRQLLLLQRLVFAEDLIDPTSLETELLAAKLADKELELTRELVKRSSPRRPKPELFAPTQRTRVRELVESKLAAGDVVGTQGAQRKPSAPTDLSDALTASIRRTRPPRKKPVRT